MLTLQSGGLHQQHKLSISDTDIWDLLSKFTNFPNQDNPELLGEWPTLEHDQYLILLTC